MASGIGRGWATASQRAGEWHLEGAGSTDHAAEDGTGGGTGANETYTTRSRVVNGEVRPGPARRPTRGQFDLDGQGKGLMTSRVKGWEMAMP
ncbi:hypothetical protein NDU88_010165 [Pleurodeles waltl]|uniref:Uncharacterized protein n=1 Tax=Pleurodeles waltl TaxID=8319 RepID=A0AAV7QZI1_PLEWA|nr:hypothetical protein NDU88_010165 [Pleurodeles waltl]